MRMPLTFGRLDRYIVREVGIALFAAAAVLLLIMTGSNAARLLGLAAEGRLPADVVPKIILFGMAQTGILILPAALFIALLLAFGRLYRDSEMTALAASGVGPMRLYGSFAWLLLPLVLAQGWMTLVIAPAVSDRIDAIRTDAERRSELLGMTPGRFIVTRGGGVIFIESMDAGRMGPVFIHTPEGEDARVVLADSGEQRIDPLTGERYLVLFDGHRYEGTAGRGDFRIIDFETHGILVPDPSAVTARQHRGSVPTRDLIGSSNRSWTAELHWRLSFPISMLLLAALALPLSHSAPRQGRFTRLAVGILVYVIYANLLTIGRSWLGAGTTPTWLGLWWVHALTAGIALAMIAQQHGRLRPLRPPAQRGPAT